MLVVVVVVVVEGVARRRVKQKIFQNTVYFPAQRCLHFQKVLNSLPLSTQNLTHHIQRASENYLLGMLFLTITFPLVPVQWTYIVMQAPFWRADTNLTVLDLTPIQLNTAFLSSSSFFAQEACIFSHSRLSNLFSMELQQTVISVTLCFIWKFSLWKLNTTIPRHQNKVFKLHFSLN